MHSAVLQCTWATCNRLGTIRCVYCMCRREMCIGMCMHTLNDSTCFAFILSFSLPLLSLHLRLCPYHFTPAVAPWSPPHLPGFYVSLAPIHWAHWSKSAFILSLVWPMAYNGFPLFYCIESKFLRLVFEAHNWFLFCPPPISPISFLVIPLCVLQPSNCAYRPAHMVCLFPCLLSACEYTLLLSANPCLSLQDPS